MNPSPVDLYLARAGHRAATEEGRERGSDKRKRWSDVRSDGWTKDGGYGLFVGIWNIVWRIVGRLANAGYVIILRGGRIIFFLYRGWHCWQWRERARCVETKFINSFHGERETRERFFEKRKRKRKRNWLASRKTLVGYGITRFICYFRVL